MSTPEPYSPPTKKAAWIALVICLLITLGAMLLASQVQQDFGKVDISNVTFDNPNGILVRAKLLRPKRDSNPAPGVVYIHGYQNNRETSDAYAIEMARRGFVVLAIDAIGRGNSGNPGDLVDPNFDPTFGGETAFKYLKSLPYVDSDRVGLMGHSLGAEMVYTIALEDPTVRALVISGFAYKGDATLDRPQNMLMIFGQYDEYRERMTGTNDVAAEWMSSHQTRAAIGEGVLDFGVTYGDFATGTARKVVLLPVIHIKESHSQEGVAAAVAWMREALEPDPALWVDPESQIWEIKEYATLVAMFAGLFSVMPLGSLLIETKTFRELKGKVTDIYTCPSKEVWRHATINGVLIWLYLPIILILFALHVYVIPIDKLFPMMMVNGTVWWFLWINIIGFFILRRWYRQKNKKAGLRWYDLGISFETDKFVLDWAILRKTAVLGLLLFACVYALEHILEAIFIVDYRFIFPFASDLTPYRFGMWMLYFPFLLAGFLQMGFFLHGQIRGPKRRTWLGTWFVWSEKNKLVMIIPIILFMLVQYLPIFTVGVIPFVGPGGMLASFAMNLFHIIGVLILIIPIQTWFFQLTGKPYLGAVLNAAIVAWMFTSSQVIAPIPV